MKKVILGSVLAVAAASSFAAVADQTFCTGASGAANAAPAATVNTGTDQNFVKAVFTPKCSSNISLAGRDGGVYYTVGAGSSKGKTSFMGSSAGGGIVSSATCATTGCAISDATTAMAAAPSS